MSGYFYALAIFILFFALLFYNYGNFAVVVCKWSKKPRFVKRKGKKVVLPGKLSASEYVKCYIPVYQAAVVREALYRSTGPFSIMGIIGLVLVIIRILFITVIPAPPILQLISIFGLLLGLLLIILTYGIVTADCAKMYSFSVPVIILNFLAPCLFCFWMQNNIADVMRQMHREDTFNEHEDDTVVKQRHS